MPSNLKGQHGRSDELLMDPDAVELVEDPDHPLYDPTVKDPPPDELVDSMRNPDIGQLQAIVIVTDGGHALCAVGRNRLKAARIIKHEYDRKFLIRCKVRKAPGGKLDKIANLIPVENNIRKVEKPSQRADGMQRLLNRGRTKEEVASFYGLKSVRQVDNVLALLDCAESVVAAADAGVITMDVVGKISKKPRAEQTKLLAEMREKKATRGKAAEKALEGAGVEKPKRLQRRSVLERLAVEIINVSSFSTMNRTDLHQFVVWVIGGGSRDTITHRTLRSLIACAEGAKEEQA